MPPAEREKEESSSWSMTAAATSRCRVWRFGLRLNLLREYSRLFHSHCVNKNSWVATAQNMRVLCVAEKPSISKAVAGHLSGGSIQTVSPIPQPSKAAANSVARSMARATSISKTTASPLTLASLGGLAT